MNDQRGSGARPVGRPPLDAEAERNRLLDAARAEFCQHGLQRASVAAIARRAGVSVPTLYRRCGSKDEITSATVLRDVLSVLANLEKAMLQLHTAEQRVVEAFVVGMREARTNQLVAAIREHEPEAIPAQLFSPEDAGRRLLRSTIAAFLQDGTLDSHAAEQAAELAIRIIATLLMTPTPVLPTETDEAARTFAEKYFVPIIHAARTGPA